MSRTRRLVLAAATVVLVAIAVLLARYGVPWERDRGGSATSRIDGEAPEGVRVRVEVLNASDTRGLARRATLHLRDRRFDVVYFGTSRPVRNSTVVLDRSGHPEWASLVADALGGVPVESAPDTSRYLDVTVLLGPDWSPPTEPLYP
jgi:hypothetical protein